MRITSSNLGRASTWNRCLYMFIHILCRQTQAHLLRVYVLICAEVRLSLCILSASVPNTGAGRPPAQRWRAWSGHGSGCGTGRTPGFGFNIPPFAGLFLSRSRLCVCFWSLFCSIVRIAICVVEVLVTGSEQQGRLMGKMQHLTALSLSAKERTFSGAGRLLSPVSSFSLHSL